jgi:hypothetical protein
LDSLKSALTQMWKPYIVIYLHDHHPPNLPPLLPKQIGQNKKTKLLSCTVGLC